MKLKDLNKKIMRLGKELKEAKENRKKKSLKHSLNSLNRRQQMTCHKSPSRYLLQKHSHNRKTEMPNHFWKKHNRGAKVGFTSTNQ